MAAAVDDARHGSAARFTLVAMPAAITTTTATNTAAIAAQWPAVWQLHLQPQPHPQQQRRLLQRQQQLHFRFTAAAQPNATAVVPFAWLGGSRWGRPHELFTLSRNTSGGLSSDATTISISARASSGSASGYESDSDGEVGFSSDLHLDMINCQICRQPLSARPGKEKRRGWLPWQWGGKGGTSGSSSSNKGGSPFLVCDCCQRCYHAGCCAAKGISTRERKGTWFHSDACRACAQGLRQQVKAGPTPAPGGRTWQLIDCAPVDPSSSSGLAALKALKQQLSDVLDVLLPAFGPGAARQVADMSKGYAALLRQGSLPVSAGLLDVYGQELAVLDLVATALEEQGQGHSRALLQSLEGWLGPQLGVARLIAVCPADEPRNVQLWQSKFGFKPLSAGDLKALTSSVPPLNFYEDATLLSKPLAKTRQAAKQPGSDKQQQASKASKAEEQPMAAEEPVAGGAEQQA